MDIIKIQLEKIGKGCVTSMWDMVVLRVGDRFAVGRSVSIHQVSLTIDEAVEVLYRAKLSY